MNALELLEELQQMDCAGVDLSSLTVRSATRINDDIVDDNGDVVTTSFNDTIDHEFTLIVDY